MLPEGLIATEWMGPLCPTKRNGLTLGLKFHTMTVPSREPETTCLRLGLKQVESTPSLWPLNERLRAGSASAPGCPGTLLADEVLAPLVVAFIMCIYFNLNLNIESCHVFILLGALVRRKMLKVKYILKLVD